MERFVRLVVGGGVVLVAGLWAVSLLDPASVPWSAGAVALAAGATALALGIRRGIAGTDV